MDAIQVVTPDFTVTVHHTGKVTAVVTFDDEMDYRPTDITNTTLGEILLSFYSHLWRKPE